MQVERHHTKDHQRIPHPADDELLNRRHSRLGPVLIEGEQMMQGQTDTNPGACQNQQMVGKHQYQNRGNRHQKPWKKTVTARVLAEVVVCKPKNNPANKRHHRGHPDRYPVWIQAEAPTQGG